MRKSYLAGAVLLLLALVAGWYFGSPWWTLRQMEAAAKASDADRLSAYVDYPALRDDLKADLSARMKAEAARDNSPAAQLGMAMGMAMLNPMIEAFVTPDSLRAALERMQVGGSDKQGAQKGPAADGGSGGEGREKPGPRIERLGFNRFRLEDPQNPGTGLLFDRHGLGWKLSGIDLPEASARTAR